MGIYEVTLRVLVNAISPDAAAEGVAEMLDEYGDGDTRVVSAKARDTGADRLPPEGLAISRQDCVVRFSIDPWAVLDGERFDAFVMTRTNEDAREARVAPSSGLLCVVRHEPTGDLTRDSHDARDDELEAGQFCGGRWDPDGGRKVFFYAKK